MAVAVLYVTGWCRSGSTVLGNILGEVPGVFHVGELRFLWLNGVLGEGSNRRCGCGADLMDCPLWSRVLEAGCPSARPAGSSLAGHAADVTRWQAACRTRHTWRVLREPPRNGWPETLAATYRAIAAASGAQLVVDTSKYASDAALLTHLPGIEPSYVHLVRDPRGAAMSWLHPKDYTGRRGALNSTAYWLGFNLAAEAVSAARPRAALRLRYEDLIRDPRGSVAQVLTLARRGTGEPQAGQSPAGETLAGESPAGDPPVSADGRAELGPNHTVTGNPNRFDRGSIQLREDRRWHDGLPPLQRAVTTALALPLIGRYGYLRGH